MDVEDLLPILEACVLLGFAWLKEGDRFAEGRWSTAVTGAPILVEALAWLDCRIHARYPAGTHTIYVGEVLASGVPTPAEAIGRESC